MTQIPQSPYPFRHQALSNAGQPSRSFDHASAVDRDLRLRKHADYQRVYKATRKQFSASMSWFLAPRFAPVESTPIEVRPVKSGIVKSGIVKSGIVKSGPVKSRQVNITGPRVGLTAGKVLGKAHERNRIKRRMREAVRHAIHELPEGVDLILHPKRSVMTMDFVKLKAEVLRIFRQAAAQTREAMSRAAQDRTTLEPIQGPVIRPESMAKSISMPAAKSVNKS